MEIYPDSLIFLYSGIPLDPSYKNTLWFDTQVDQSNFFHHTTDPEQDSYLKAVFQRQYYTRVNRGQIKVKICADRIYDCNYLSFENLSYGSKWFYAFITSIEWVNNEVSLITFEIDVMQTYMFDAELKQCFVEREHTATDIIGRERIEEDLNCGTEYEVSNTVINFQYQPDSEFSLMSENWVTGQTPDASKKANLFCALDASGMQGSDATILADIQAKLDHLGGESIVAMYQLPHQMLSGTSPTVFTATHGPISAIPPSFDGYVPKNNKLYNAPYNYLYITNNQGGVLELRPELFATPSSVTFEAKGSALPVPQVMLTPNAYEGLTPNYQHSLMLDGYPTIPTVSDAYKYYVSQHEESDALRVAVNGVATALSVGLAVASGNPAVVGAGIVSGSVSVAQTAGSIIGGYIEAGVAPNSLRNLTNSDSIRLGHSRYMYSAYRVTIQRDYAEAIDNYFTMYGYACRKVKVPNRNVRPHFTYTKTVGCTIIGKMPADDAVAMQNIYDKGITFWKYASEVGDYSVNNAPVSNGV